jgi:hypothetical protein
MGLTLSFTQSILVNDPVRSDVCKSDIGLGVEVLSIKEDTVCNAFELAKMINMSLRGLASYEEYLI